jgi:quinol monooxygenase YgiN
MFARSVSVRLKPESIQQFTEIMESQIVPTLRKQPGFENVITLNTTGSPDLVTISIWDTTEHLEAYNTAVYPQMLKSLEAVLSGTPTIKVRNVLGSTLTNSKQAVA